jgi:hypothetical protein
VRGTSRAILNADQFNVRLQHALDKMSDAKLASKGGFGRGLLAFLWLTLGYWVISFIVPFLLLFLPFAGSGGGISESSANGVHRVRFDGQPGDVIAYMYVNQSGPKDETFTTPPVPSHGGSTFFRWANAYTQLALVCIYALISIPVLKRILRNQAPQNRGEVFRV